MSPPDVPNLLACQTTPAPRSSRERHGDLTGCRKPADQFAVETPNLVSAPFLGARLDSTRGERQPTEEMLPARCMDACSGGRPRCTTRMRVPAAVVVSVNSTWVEPGGSSNTSSTGLRPSTSMLSTSLTDAQHHGAARIRAEGANGIGAMRPTGP